ncbi:Uncharacterised protein [Mycobacteroides abscessus subsp. abscessus]|nr:Uncharacterised protein [Mycobacteroides abscessus subsp. abscessus]
MASNSSAASGSRMTLSGRLASVPRLCSVHKVVAETPSRLSPLIRDEPLGRRASDSVMTLMLVKWGDGGTVPWLG